MCAKPWRNPCHLKIPPLIMRQLLSHYPFAQYPLRLLKEASRILKKNGQIVIGIVDKNSFLGTFFTTRLYLIF